MKLLERLLESNQHPEEVCGIVQNRCWALTYTAAFVRNLAPDAAWHLCCAASESTPFSTSHHFNLPATDHPKPCQTSRRKYPLVAVCRFQHKLDDISPLSWTLNLIADSSGRR
jgi:hypothetical protein